MVMYCNNCNSTFPYCWTEYVARDYKRSVLRPCGQKRKDIGGSPYGQLPVAHVPLRVYGSPPELECSNETKCLVLTNTDAPNFALL